VNILKDHPIRVSLDEDGALVLRFEEFDIYTTRSGMWRVVTNTSLTDWQEVKRALPTLQAAIEKALALGRKP
jgi:hypothetical protein